MKIIIALLIFSAIILFHELGHFLLAKLNGVTVLEFSLGMGPRILHKEIGGTCYSLKLLPFGGSCMMLGEDEATAQEGSFGSKSVWARISIVAAGPIFNFILAFIFSVIIVMNVGYDAPEVLGVSEGLPAQAAGIREGDRIVRMNGKRIHLYREFYNYTTFHPGKTVEFVCERDGQLYEFTVTPQMTENGYKYGISGSFQNRKKTGFLETLEYGIYEVKYWIDATIDSIKMMFEGKVTLDSVSGPVGVVDVIGDTYESSKSDGAYYIWLNLLNIAILLTANLGVMNLLPLPALDGGRLFFLIIEAIRRKKVNPEIEGRIHVAGLMILLLLMVVVMANDIRKIIF